MADKARLPARRKKRRKIVDEYCSYIVEIKDWEVTYSHGLNSTPNFFPVSIQNIWIFVLKAFFICPRNILRKR